MAALTRLSTSVAAGRRRAPSHGPESGQLHPWRHGRDLGQRHGVGHTFYTYEDAEGLSADDLSSYRVPTGRAAAVAAQLPTTTSASGRSGPVGHAYSSPVTCRRNAFDMARSGSRSPVGRGVDTRFRLPAEGHVGRVLEVPDLHEGEERGHAHPPSNPPGRQSSRCRARMRPHRCNRRGRPRWRRHRHPGPAHPAAYCAIGWGCASSR